MTTIDAFTFFQELDILELRLSELSPVVDRFVLVEANRTHKGTLKPLHYAENKARFAEWEHKIVHVVCPLPDDGDGLPAIRRREMMQRNAILQGVKDCAGGDVILISDCDEIPRPNMIPRAIHDGIVAAYIQKLFYFNFNTFAYQRPWPGTRVCSVADARALSPHIIRNGMGYNDIHYPIHRQIDDGGWHFSYFGGTEAIQTKMTEFLHQELVTPENTSADAIAEKIAQGVDIWGRPNEQVFNIGPANDLPYAVLRELPKYAPHFAEGWRPVFNEDWYSGGQALYMAHLARCAPDGAIVEIGCWEGRSTIALAQVAYPRVVQCVDHWQGNPDEGTAHPATVAALARDVFATFRANMERCTAGNYRVAPVSWQEWIATWDAPIAFLHLDASHDRESVRDCLTAIKPYLVPGAILCGDDAYSGAVMAGVRDVFAHGEVIGDRLWKVTYEAA